MILCCTNFRPQSLYFQCIWTLIYLCTYNCRHGNSNIWFRRTLLWTINEIGLSFPSLATWYSMGTACLYTLEPQLFHPMLCSWHFSQVSSLTISGRMIRVSAFLLQMSAKLWFRSSTVNIMMNKTRERGVVHKWR